MAAKRKAAGKAKARSPRKARVKQRPERGFCLFCCLAYLMVPAIIGVLAALFFAFLWVTHSQKELLGSLRSFKLPPLDSVVALIVISVLGLFFLLNYLCINAIWRWKRWGAYVLYIWLALPLIACIISLINGAPLASTLQDVRGILLGYLFPYGVLLCLLFPVWKYMD